MKLTSHQIELIQQKIDQSKISIATLRDDLLDHLCCAVEEMMKKNIPLEIALQESIDSLAPEGLNKIQEDTIFLLNSKRIIIMKKVMYVTGLISTISISLGFIFKILNWLGGWQLLLYGTLGFVFLFVPLLALNYYKTNIQKALSEKFRITLGVSSAFLFGTSVVFKIMSLQGADILLLASGLTFSFGFLPFLFYKMYQKSVS
jgi:hypothetical protein